MMMSTKQSSVHNETIWKSTDLRNFPSLDLANLSLYMETGEMLSKMVILPDIMWNSMTSFINFAKCENFPDTL